MKRTPHPVRGAYQYADTTTACPNCGAEPYVWCRTPAGTVRSMPCVARLQAPLDADTTDQLEIEP